MSKQRGPVQVQQNLREDMFRGAKASEQDAWLMASCSGLDSLRWVDAARRHFRRLPGSPPAPPQDNIEYRGKYQAESGYHAAKPGL